MGICLLLAPNVGAAQPATAPIWTVEGGAGLDHFLAGVAVAVQHHDSACLALEQSQPASLPLDGQIWLRAGGGKVRLLQTDGRGLDQLDAPWAKAALAAALVAEKLGSLVAPLDIWLRWQNGTYSVGTRNQAGQTFDDPCSALGQVVALLLAANHPGTAPDTLLTPPPDGIKIGLLAPQILALGRLVAGQAILIGRGSVVTVRLESLPFAEPPLLAASDGLSIINLRQQDGYWLADIRMAPTTTRSTANLAIYAPNHRFTPLYTIPLTVVSGEDNSALTIPDQIGAALTVGQTIRGQLGANSTVQHPITLTQQTTITIQSTGSSDVKASLRDAFGNVLAADDDSAGQYRFSLSASLVEGAYWLQVEHCCGQAAQYHIHLSAQ